MVDDNQQPVQPTPQATPEDIEKNKALAIVGYILPFLFFIPLLNDQSKNSPFAKFHANQQLVLLIAYVVISIAASMLPWGLWYLTSLVRLALFVLAIINAVSASKGEMKPLPVVGGISILK
jgi:uncharacterized membrane protein